MHTPLWIFLLTCEMKLGSVLVLWMQYSNDVQYPQFFLELITTQLRFYMVSPQLSLLIILTMQSYKFYWCTVPYRLGLR